MNLFCKTLYKWLVLTVNYVNVSCTSLYCLLSLVLCAILSLHHQYIYCYIMCLYLAGHSSTILDICGVFVFVQVSSMCYMCHSFMFEKLASLYNTIQALYYFVVQNHDFNCNCHTLINCSMSQSS